MYQRHNFSGCFNPYFTGLPILIFGKTVINVNRIIGFNPYFTGLPILIVNMYEGVKLVNCFNPYFTGLPILITE